MSTLRWCNIRTRPRRETRGVSRSKCGDLITACVPVTWAISIIVYESADATDFNDGFGTGELVVGVRAYQWGWEYYYPKSIDLNYSVRPSYSSFIGNSLKYNHASGHNLDSNNLWKLYQNKLEDKIVTPAHLLLLPTENGKTVNFFNCLDIGSNTLKGSEAFSSVRNSTKAYNTSLLTLTSPNVSKYFKIHELYFNDNNFLDSANYGIKRQHSLISPSSTTNNFSTFFDSNNKDHFLTYTLGSTTGKASSVQFDLNTQDFSPKTPFSLTKNALNSLSLLELGTNGSNNNALLNLLNFPKIVSEVNADSDGSVVSSPVLKLTNTNMGKNYLYDWTQFRNSNFLQGRGSQAASTSLLKTPTSTNKVLSSAGPNTKILLSDQSVRQYTNLKPTQSNYNLSDGTNPLTSNTYLLNATNPASTLATNYLANKSNNVDLSVVNHVLSSRDFLEGTHFPNRSNNPSISRLDYNSMASQNVLFDVNRSSVTQKVFTKNLDTVDLLQGAREKAPSSINASYWSFFWRNSNLDLRLTPVQNFTSVTDTLYAAPFVGYSEYDFRNDQSIDMLEDVYWETSLPTYTYYDYLNLNKTFKSVAADDQKTLTLENFFFNNFLPNRSNSTKSFNKMPSSSLRFYMNPVHFDDSVTSISHMQQSELSQFPLINDLSENDETYNAYKNLLEYNNFYSSTLLGVDSPSLFPQTYLAVLNNFRGDYEDFGWWLGTSRTANSSDEGLSPKLLNDNLVLSNLDLLNGYNTSFNDLRVASSPVLRSSVRNLVVNYNAFQKVSRARFDEGRANTSAKQFAYLGQKQAFITDSKVPYLSLLKKNTDSFYNTTLYNTKPLFTLNDTDALFTLPNTPFYDFPFLLSQTSDVIRYAWIDWFAQWKYIEVQPSSVSRFSTLGMPYLRKPFDFNTSAGDQFQDTEAYFTRISRSRKNYLPNWLYTPYFYNRFYVWNKMGSVTETFLTGNSTASMQKNNLKQMSWYWNDMFYKNTDQAQQTYSYSGDNSYSKSTYRPQSSIQTYYTSLNHLTDILSKREFLYRQYFESKNNLVRLPLELTVNPNNPLLNEFKDSFLFIDPTNYISEEARSTTYSSLAFFKVLYLKEALNFLSTSSHKLPFNATLFNEYLLFYFFGTNSNKIGRNEELYKNPYRPLRKGVSSLLRMHATGAIAMPVEIRLQILASSRDVIHSWAIPSAGVKIDCVPGYTSHRIMIFLLTGIYWGQCQEICGRYHHWMPIVAYFMKRDLFFLWCTHFVFNSTAQGDWDISDRQFSDYLNFVSYDKSSWVTELTQTA